MSGHFLRTYQKFDLNDIAGHLLIYGDLSAQCGKCQATDLKLEDHACGQCATEFKYIAFRNVRQHLPKLQKIHAQRPGIILIDFDDYKRETSAQKAKDFLK